jgi:hypothetical protein
MDFGKCSLGAHCKFEGRSLVERKTLTGNLIYDIHNRYLI